MKIFFLIANLGNGGQERQLTYLVKGLVTGGHSVKVFLWNHMDEDFHRETLEQSGIQILFAGEKGNSIISKLRYLHQRVVDEKPMILQSFSFYLNFYTWLISLFTNTVPFGAIRSHIKLYKQQTPWLAYILSAYFPARFISNNHTFHNGKINHLLKNYLIKRTTVITNAILPANFVNTGKRFTKGKLPIITVSIGRLAMEKRIDLLILIHDKLRREGLPIKHYHAGDGPEKGALQEHINSLGLSDSFILTGINTDIALFLTEADLFLYTSDFEGCPNAILEAMTAGLPVISTACGDTEYLIHDNKGGFVVPTGEWEEIADKAQKLLKEPALMMRMGEYNANFSKEHFTVESMTQQYITSYQQILKK